MNYSAKSKEQQRIDRNRLSAVKSREKKLNHLQELQLEVDKLRNENEVLQQNIDDLKTYFLERDMTFVDNIPEYDSLLPSKEPAVFSY
jgi:cell division protein FtsB